MTLLGDWVIQSASRRVGRDASCHIRITHERPKLQYWVSLLALQLPLPSAPKVVIMERFKLSFFFCPNDRGIWARGSIPVEL